MKRIIKFRFWDIDNKVLTQGFTLEEIQNAGKGFNQTSVSEIERIKVFEDNNNTSTNNGCVLYLHKEANTKSNVEVMQFTGLHDKNGKEIYKGDIVKIDKLGKYRVDYLDHSMKFFFQTLDDNKTSFTATPEMIEIIGNVFQNPELLK